MKILHAIIKPFKIDDVKESLFQHHNIDEITVTEVRGFARQKGHLELYKGAEYVHDYVPKLQISFPIHEQQTNEIIDTICDTARTGKIGDGKIWVESDKTMVRNIALDNKMVEVDTTHEDQRVSALSVIQAIIRPIKLDDLREYLKPPGMTVIDVKRHDREIYSVNHRLQHLAQEKSVDFIYKIKVILIMKTKDMYEGQHIYKNKAPVGNIDLICAVCRTGRAGDGVIYTMPIERLVRIRTGETGIDAL